MIPYNKAKKDYPYAQKNHHYKKTPYPSQQDFFLLYELLFYAKKNHPSSGDFTKKAEQ
ncbi:hypothetical protein CHCC5025_1192 [Bacillus licheniformis]|nr:hypothetical protein BSSX_p0030 [Bacillus subtilis]TWJ48190.1 hypothetical protein CHCC5025_1192 [Bacillus licheniformis]TWJ82623.1 hypothetical protein CHCC20497_2093 [Bacillus paralicheniformis]TWK70876.1 hypothetical protein CHCC20342_2543 [Bacillus licheniformis]TWM95788.1 hypothetical protein CHCC14596_4291 [Bacillus licheniformis]